MVKDLIKLFAETGKIEEIVLDNYKLKNGVYFKISKDGSYKKTLVKDNESDNIELDKWFRLADYYSQIIDTNKAIDIKRKIHSNNYLTLFIKLDTLPIIGKGKILTSTELEESIKRYYDALLMDVKPDKYAKLIIEKLNFAEINKEDIENTKQYLLQNIETFINEAKTMEVDNKGYLKIFFDAEIEEYKREYINYTLPRIFNVNKYNIEIEEEIFGLSNDNMSLNDKKPYLELKSTKFKVPFRISLEEAIVSKGLFEWIKNLQDEEGKPIRTVYIPINRKFEGILETVGKDSSMYIYHEQNNGKAIIKDFEILNKFSNFPIFEYKNYLDTPNFDEKAITEIKELEQKMDYYYYNNKLRKNYYTQKIEGNDLTNDFINILYITRDAMLNYFRKGKQRPFLDCVDEVTLKLTIDKFKYLEENKTYDIEKAVNFRLNLFRYFNRGGKKEMGDRVIELLKSTLKKAESDEPVHCTNDEEFYFMAGQLARYIIVQSEAKKKTYDFFEPFMIAKNAKTLKQKLGEAQIKYNHAINIGYKKFENLNTMVMGYETDSKVKDYIDMFLAGICAKNILLIKKEDKKDGNE